MTTATYPERIQQILDRLHTEDWGDIWYDVSNDRDRALTESLCPSDFCDFVILEGEEAFLFLPNEQTGEWTVHLVGKPVYEVDPEMVGEGVDFEDFLAELQYELRGVEVRRGSNADSEFVQWFRDRLDKAFEVALESVR